MISPIIASNATDWILALSTLGLGVLGLFLTGWQFWASGFRPREHVLLGLNGDSLRVQITNRGRGSGLIHHVAVTNKAKHAVAGTFRSLPSGRYSPQTMQAYARMELTIEPPEGTNYSTENRIIIAWGKHTSTLTPTQADVSFYGLEPFLPVGAGIG